MTGIFAQLASLPAGSHINARGLAEALGICKKSVERAVRRGELPAPFRMGGRNVWMVSTILEHFEARQRQALEKAGRMERRRAS